MADLKKLHNVSLIVDKQGSTSLDVPKDMPQDKANDLARRFDIMDRIYLSQMEEFKNVVSKYPAVKNDVLFESIKTRQEILERSHARNITEE